MPTVRKSPRNARKAPGYYYHEEISDEESLSEIEYDEPENEKWEIEYIKGARVNEEGLWEYLVKWVDFPERLASWEPWVPPDGAAGGLNETKQYLEDFYEEAEDQGYPLNTSYEPGFEVIARPDFIETAEESFRVHRALRRKTGLEDDRYIEEQEKQLRRWYKMNDISPFTITVPPQHQTPPPQIDTVPSTEDLDRPGIELLGMPEEYDSQTLVDDGQFEPEWQSPFEPFEALSHTENSPEPASDRESLFDARFSPSFDSIEASLQTENLPEPASNYDSHVDHDAYPPESPVNDSQLGGLDSTPFGPYEALMRTESSSEPAYPLPRPEPSYRHIKIHSPLHVISGSHLSTKKRIAQSQYAPMYNRSVSPELGLPISNQGLDKTLTSAADDREWSVCDSDYQF